MILSFVESPGFVHQVESLLTSHELRSLQAALIANPAQGVLIPGTRGLRKLRWGARGAGKRGGVRVIYYWQSSDGVLYLLDVYDKRRRADLGVKQLLKLRASLQTD